MSDETIKWKIRVLYSVINKINGANNKLNDFRSSINNLSKVLGDNIKINDEIVYREYQNNALLESSNVSGNISNKIVPSLYYSIHKLEEELKN